MKERLVVIGNGMAPGRALERLLESAPDAYDITIFNAEPRVNYDRIMLSPVLAGDKTFDQIIIHGDSWYVKHGITLYKGVAVTKIDRAAKTVISTIGETVPYDKLIIATGSRPIIIPVPGANLPGVLTYRDLDDVQAMLLAAKSRGSAVVIGGGLLGLEAAAGLKEQGMDVTVVHLMPTLMERQLDAAAGHLLKKALEARGIHVLTKANTKAIRGDKTVRAVQLEDGTELPADLVVMAVGIRPNSALASEAGLAVSRGIVVDETMRTSDPVIFALGECAEAHGVAYGLVAPLYEMANVLAAQLAGDESAKFIPPSTATKLKVTGINLYSAGDFADGKDREEIVLRDAARGNYRRLVLTDNKIIGAVMYGDTSDGPWFFDLLKRGVDIGEMRETLIFGQGYAGGIPLDPTAAVAALPDDAEVCGCNGVCKGKITGAITGLGLKSIDEVRAHTKASASCGSCTGLVEQLLKATLGDAYNPAAVQPICACTDLGHDDVRRLIVAKGLKSIPDLMQALEWKTSCGCAKCRPALNYYLLATWPGEYEDDGQSRFINERVHANIQKDGTYSVVPRMWGGVTSAHELRAIADVVEKFRIPTVKVTGGQRIDMLGVKQGRPSGRLGRPQRRRNGLGRRLCQRSSHRKNLRGHGLVPLRNAGFHRPWRQDRKVHVGLLDPGEGQDGGVGLPAKLRRGDLQGCRRDLRGLWLRHSFRGRGRPRHQGHRGVGPCRQRGGGHRNHCRAGPALPRAGPLSGAHLQMGQAGRARHYSPAGSGGSGAARGATRPLCLFAEIRATRPVG